MNIFGRLYINLNQSRNDRLVWKFVRKGLCSVRSFYVTLEGIDGLFKISSVKILCGED